MVSPSLRTYEDAGKSGLRIDGRDALQRLIEDVQTGRADFDVILVYDVSRWGRFQDADESAYYEYICRRAGIDVHYCAEQFENDGSPVSTIVKGVKRAMAGEYSRELSAKVFKGQCRLIELGFRQGGHAGLRTAPDAASTRAAQPKGAPGAGRTEEHPDRPRDPRARAARRGRDRPLDLPAVRRGRQGRTEIADVLNAEGHHTDLGRPWTRGTVHQVLTNEKYIGNNVYNRVSFKLKKKRVVNPPDMWIRADGAFESVVSGRRLLHGARDHPRAEPSIHERGAAGVTCGSCWSAKGGCPAC